MHLIIAPDSFKESMSAKVAAHSIEKGWRSVYGENAIIDIIPLADGGEGTIEALSAVMSLTKYQVQVTGPNRSSVNAAYALDHKSRTAVIEVAEASGLALVPKQNRDPRHATSYGTGELILAALNQGAQKLIIGLGGSATNDGGAGLIQALGARLFNKENQLIASPIPAKELVNVHKVDVSTIDKRIFKAEITAACDVTNPVLGSNGASVVYGPQKGATVEMVQTLEQALGQFIIALEDSTQKKVAELPGGGAAGGIGSCLYACLDASLDRGIDIVLSHSNFADKVQKADLIITGEGKIDYQTVQGKTPVGIARAAHSTHPEIPVVAICGQLGEKYEEVYEHGITAAFSMVSGPLSLQEAMENASFHIENTSKAIARLWKSKP